MPGCEYCHQIGSHDFRCPKYVYPKPKMYCSNCGGGIYEGEEYIKNDDEKCSHYDCFLNMRELAEWLGYDVRTMECDY